MMGGKLTATTLSAFGGLVRCADMDEIPVDSQLPTVLDKVRLYEKSLNAMQIKSLVKLVTQRLTQAPSDLRAEFAVKAYSFILKYIGFGDHMKNIPTSLRSKFCENLAKNVYVREPWSKTTEVSDFCMQTTMSMRKYGNLMFGMGKKSLESYATDAAIKKDIDMLQAGVVSCDARSYLTAKVKALFTTMTTADAAQIGSIFLDYTPAELDGIKDKLCKVLPLLVKPIKKHWRFLKKRRERGFATVYDCLENKQNVVDVYNKLIEIEKSSACTTASPARKKRAAAASLTCSKVKSMGNIMVVLTVNDFKSMTTAEFKACTATLGTMIGFSTEQHTELANKAKTAYGQPDTWSQSTVELIGGLTSGLGTQDMAKLSISTISALKAVGSYGNWSITSTLTQAFKQYLKGMKGGNATDVSALDLRVMGSLACGATVDHIQDFSNAAVCGALEQVGKRMECEDKQLQTYASKGIHATCLGSNVAAWTGQEVANLGTLIGGLSKVNLAKLTQDAIGEIKPQTVKAIPAINFNGFTTTQLGWFSVNQLGSIQPSQYNSLDEDKKSLVVANTAKYKAELGDPTKTVGDKGPGGNNKSGCGFLEASVLLLATTIMAVFLRI